MISLIALTLLTGEAGAVWPTTVQDLNTIAGQESNADGWYHSIPSVSGRTIITWDDAIGFDYCPQYQIMDKYGNWMFEQNQDLYDRSFNVVMFEAISDDEGGAVFLSRKSVEDIGDYIYIQRIDSMGNKLWGENGILVAYEIEVPPPLTSGVTCLDLYRDEFTGNYFVMYKRTNINSSLTKLQVHKLDANANALWPGEGVVLADSGLNAGTEPMYNCLATDISGGVYAVWYRTENNDDKIYMQHLDANGNRLWQDYAKGKLIYNTGSLTISCPEVLSDGVGGVYVCDTQYLRRYDSAGTMLWQNWISGFKTFLHAGDADDLYTTSVCYFGPGYILNSQHFNREGQSLWPGSSLQLSTYPYNDDTMYLYGAFYEGGYLYVAFSSTHRRNIICQKVSSGGVLQWGNGIWMAASSQWLNLERAACGDQAGGMIVEFTNNYHDICVKRVRFDGTLGGDYAKIEDVTISMLGNDAVITWPGQYENARYYIYKNESPYGLSIHPISTTSDTFYVDTNAAAQGAAF